MELQIGQRLQIRYQDQIFFVGVINPHHFAYNRPLIGLNFSRQEKSSKLSHSTLQQWLKGAKKQEPALFTEDIEVTKIEHLRLPKSKKIYPVHCIPCYNNDSTTSEPYRIERFIEIGDYIDLCFQVICNEDVNKKTKHNIANFLKWFTVQGFYAEAFIQIKGSFDEADSLELQQWLTARLHNKSNRKSYAQLIVELYENPAFWSNFTYLYLFGKLASQMKIEWKTMAGDKSIARNHVPEAVALEAIGFVERQVVELYTGDIREAHILAISVATKKFTLPPKGEIDESVLYQDYRTLKLSFEDRNNIIKLVEEGFSVKEIAEKYQVTEPAIRYHLQRQQQKTITIPKC